VDPRRTRGRAGGASVSLTVSWSPSGLQKCAACQRVAVPPYVVRGARVYHEGCAPDVEMPTGAVANPVQIAIEHREARQAAIDDSLQMFLELSEDVRGRAESDVLREAVTVLKGEVPVTFEVIRQHDFGSGDVELARKIARAEVEGANPECCRRWRHTGAALSSGEIHHKAYPQRCHGTDFSCWRAQADEVLKRHDETIDALVAAGTLFVLEVQWPANPIGTILKQRLEAWVRLLDRQMGRKPTYLAWAAPDRLVVLLEIREDVDVGSVHVRTWEEVERWWVPIIPFNMVCTEGDADLVYERTKRGCRLVRGRGKFFRSSHPKTRTVIMTDASGTVRKESKKLCPCGCGQAAEKIQVFVLDAGELCPYCPERRERREGRASLDLYIGGTGPPK